MKKLLFLLAITGSFASAKVTHTMQPKETLYGISREYGISADQIIKLNPELSNRAPRINEEIILPNSAKQKKKETAPIASTYNHDEESTVVKKDKNFIYVKAAPKETLYSLSRKYKVSIADLEKHNSSLANGLKLGDTVKIPYIGDVAVTPSIPVKEEPKEKTTTNSTKSAINVALLLPLSTQKDLSRDFFSGAKLAADSLSDQGENIKVKIVDTDKKGFQKEIDATTNVIIGPFFKTDIVSLYLDMQKRGLQTPIASPFTTAKELDGVNNVIFYETREDFLVERLIDEVSKNFKSEDIIYVISNNKDVRETIENKVHQKNKKISILHAGKDDLSKYLKDFEGTVYTIIASDNDNDITTHLGKLQEISNTGANIKLLGTSFRKIYDNPRFHDFLIATSFIYTETKYINENGVNEKLTLDKYEAINKKNMSKYSVLGFDTTFDLLSRLNIKKELSKSAMTKEKTQLSNKYYFEQQDISYNWYNKGCRIIQITK